MAITSAIATSYKADVLNGVHQPGDAYKIALYTSSATMDATTTAYSATNEVSGSGYSAGGLALAGFAVATSGTTAYLTWTNATWTTATITSSGALIYNSTQSNKAVVVISFGGSFTSTAGNFTVQFPTAGAGTAIINLA